ncbi:DNA adenine methylase, partial [Desulforegula conservatrix]|uniref:DNA adenine methylase n=2 Tax=Desulforegula conservatrix TaxID=153026 RepID=UPI000489D7D2
GKSRLAAQIISMLPEHETYCEVCTGAGWVFFKKDPMLSKSEVLNDLDGELISFYRVVQNHLEEFLKQFKWLLTSRQMFEEWKGQLETGGLTDIQKAARYYYTQRLCYGGRVRNRSFGVSPGRAGKINIVRLEEEMSQVHMRLSGCVVEHLPWQDLVARYDRPGTFFFIDPPYYKAPYYKHNMVLDDYKEMAGILGSVKGKFLLTINDLPEIREVFKDFKQLEVKLRYSVARKSATEGNELIFTNY